MLGAVWTRLGVILPLWTVRFELVPQGFLAQELEERMIVLPVFGFGTLLLLGGPKKCLDFSISLGVILGGLYNGLSWHWIRLTIKGVSPPGGVQFLLELGVVGDAGSVDLVILAIICIEAQLFLLTLHGGRAVVGCLLARSALPLAVPRLRKTLALVAIHLFRNQHC